MYCNTLVVPNKVGAITNSCSAGLFDQGHETWFVYQLGKVLFLRIPEIHVSEGNRSLHSRQPWKFGFKFTLAVRIQDSHHPRESVIYSCQPWESSQFPSVMGIYFHFSYWMWINVQFTLSMRMELKSKYFDPETLVSPWSCHGCVISRQEFHYERLG